MSELKAHDLVDIQDYRGEVYLKSEVDKVIAEKDKEIERLKRENEMTLVGVNLRSPTSDGRLV